MSSGESGSVSKPRESVRFYEIDGLRFIAALVVVIYHYTFRGHGDGLNPLAYPELLTAISRYGYLGVDLFFVISGFVILMTAQNGDPVRFVISRVVRIYPAFWVSVTITAAVIAVYGYPLFEVDLGAWLLNLPLIGGFLGVEFVDGVYWSLLVELKFYFLVFVVLMFGSIHRMEWMLGGWILIVTLLMTVGGPGFLHFFFFPDWAHYFIAGAAFYIIRMQGFTWYRGLLVLWSYGLSVVASIEMSAELSTKFGEPFSIPATVLIISSFYAFFLAVSFKLTSRINRPELVTIGALTYPLYLVHQNVGYILFNMMPDLNRYVLLGLVFLIAVLISWAINELVEKRFNPVFRGWLISLSVLLGLQKPKETR